MAGHACWQDVNGNILGLPMVCSKDSSILFIFCTAIQAAKAAWLVAGKSQISNTKLTPCRIFCRPGLHCWQREDTVKKPLLAKLERMDALASQDFLALYKIFETAKLPEDLKNEFLQVLDTKATAGTSRETLQAGKTQVIETLPQYFTAGELALLEKQDMWSGALVVAKRLKLLGVTTMRESTKKIGTSMLVSFEHLRTGAVPCADACYVLSQHFTTAFHQCGVRVPAGVVMLAKYPLDPFDLAPAHLAASYPEEKPANAILPMLGQCRKNVAVRDTHKGVTQSSLYLLSGS